MQAPTPIDFRAFHEHDLPRRLAAGNGLLAAEAARSLAPLAFRVGEGAAFTYLPKERGFEIAAGEEAAHTVIELDPVDWSGFAQEFESAPGLLYSGRASCPRGKAMLWLRWEPVLRAMFHGRPIYDPENIDLRDAAGQPLDVGRAFDLGDDDVEMAHFLRTTGYLMVKRVFSEAEIARFLQHAEALRRDARPGDKSSWWGKNAEGEEVVCRVIHAGTIDELGALYGNPHIRRIAGLSDERLEARQPGDAEGVSVLFKNPDMVEGLSDLPWHRDCGMGGHASVCPILIVTVCLTDGSPEAGELRMLPGSWKCGYNYIDANHARAPRGVSLPVRAGDVTFHYGDVMHAAPPPTGPPPHRISLLLAFEREGERHPRGSGNFNEVLLGRDDGQVEHLAKLVEKA